MRVELNINPDCEEPYAVLHVSKLTPSLQNAIHILEKENESFILTGINGGKTYIIEPELTEIIRTEGGELVLYDRQKKRYLMNRPLYELEKQMGKNFIRISKSAIVNIRRINHVEASFNGTMEIVMKNGVEEVISRKYRRDFKERLGV